MQIQRVWNTIKQNVWRIVFVMFACCLLASHFSFQYAARYVAGDDASDGARVARFDFVLTSDFSSDTQMLAIDGMKPGDVEEYVITIQNNSEVALLCSVTPKRITNNLPLVINPVSAPVQIGGRVEVTFKIEWPSTENSPEFMGQVDVIELTISVEQID